MLIALENGLREVKCYENVHNILLASIFNFIAIKNEIQFPISRKRKDGDTDSTGITHTRPYYWSHISILLVTYPSYWSHTHHSGHTSILLVRHPFHWSRMLTRILLVTHTHPTCHTHPSYWSHTHPTSLLLILLVTHPSYWSHTYLTGHTQILLVTRSHTYPTGHKPVLLIQYQSHW